MKKILLVELKTIEPVVITSKKGKTKYIESTSHIPASTILGAAARKVILENVDSGVGNCKKICDLSELPNCDECPENCKYRRVWVDKKIKLTNAVLGKWDFSSPGLVNLQSAGESRENGTKSDLLLLMFLDRMRWLGKAERSAEKSPVHYKKRPSTFDGKDFREVEKIQITRVSIDERYKASKHGELYGFTAIRKGQKFRFMVLCDSDIGDLFNGEVKIGAWKSRGMGLVRMRVVESMEDDEYIERRSGEIEKGFEILSKTLEKYGVSGNYGTYTCMTDVTREMDLNSVFKLERGGKSVRFERRRDGDYFVVTDTITCGSVGVFEVDEPEKMSRSLAEIELEAGAEPWFDWVFFNHPVHIKKSVLNGVEV